MASTHTVGILHEYEYLSITDVNMVNSTIVSTRGQCEKCPFYMKGVLIQVGFAFESNADIY